MIDNSHSFYRAKSEHFTAIKNFYLLRIFFFHFVPSVLLYYSNKNRKQRSNRNRRKIFRTSKKFSSLWNSSQLVASRIKEFPLEQLRMSKCFFSSRVIITLDSPFAIFLIGEIYELVTISGWIDRFLPSPDEGWRWTWIPAPFAVSARSPSVV